MFMTPSDSSRRRIIMSKYIPGNQKHLTLNDRIYIENELAKGTTFKDIAAFLCKDPTTISKEVRAHRLSDWYHKGTFYNAKNFCIHRYHCQKTNACGKILLCGIKCASCPTCNQTCKDFEKERCKRLDKAPYVCNGCTKKINHCTIAHKYYYNGRAADRKYRELLISSRSGINMTKHQLHQKYQIISPLIEQGQSPYQILTNHPELDMSVRSMYTYIDKGLFTARNIDLKRQAKFKPRKCHKTQITDRSVFTHRTYSDFCSLDLSSFVEMDTVHSSRESNKTLLTLFFTKEKLFLAFLLNRCTKGAVRLITHQPLNAYEIVKTLDYMNIKYWFNIGTSTVYATIKTLEKKQYLVGEIQKDGNMPDKTVYSITEQGKAVFLETLRTSFLRFDYDTNIFSITAFFLDCLPEKEQKTLLEQRMTVLQEYLAGIQKQHTEEWEKQVNPYHVANLQRMTDIVLAEISGTERLFKATTE